MYFALILQQSDYWQVLEELASEQDTMDNVTMVPVPRLQRSNSSPALFKTSETSDCPTTVTALSPRMVARSFLEDEAQRPGSYKDPSFLEKQYPQDASSRIVPAAETGGKSNERDDQEIGILQTSGSSEYVDISYKDVETAETKMAAKADPSSTSADTQDGGAMSKATIEKQMEGDRPLEKPQTLPVVPHPTKPEASLSRRNLEHVHHFPRPRGHTVSIMVQRDRHKGQQGDARGRRGTDVKHRGSFIGKDSYRSGLNPRY